MCRGDLRVDLGALRVELQRFEVAVVGAQRVALGARGIALCDEDVEPQLHRDRRRVAVDDRARGRESLARDRGGAVAQREST